MSLTGPQIPEASAIIDSSVVTPTPSERRVRAEPAPAATPATRLAALMDIGTSAAQEHELAAYNAAKRSNRDEEKLRGPDGKERAAGGVWRSFLLAPAQGARCSLVAPAADVDKASAALVAVWQRLFFAYALQTRLGGDSP